MMGEGFSPRLCHPGWSIHQPCHPAHQPCHPDWSVSGMEGSIAVGTKRGSARIPPLRFAPVGMTCGGSVRNGGRVCHPERGTSHVCHYVPQPCHPDGSVHHPCHPDWSVSGMEGSIAVGTMQGGARIPPLRFASVGMTYGGIYRSWYEAGQCEDSSTPLRSGRNDMGGGAGGMADKFVIPTGASAEWRDLSQLVRCGAVPGFLHYASLRWS